MTLPMESALLAALHPLIVRLQCYIGNHTDTVWIDGGTIIGDDLLFPGVRARISRCICCHCGAVKAEYVEEIYHDDHGKEVEYGA